MHANIKFMNTQNFITANVFISGHRSLTQEEFNKYYCHVIDSYIKWIDIDSDLAQKQVIFYVGDCEGCDKMAIYYLISKLCRNVKLVICSLKYPFDGQIDYSLVQNENITVIKEFSTHEERDTYMTEHTDYDVLWIREGEWSSGTAQNYVRRTWHVKS